MRTTYLTLRKGAVQAVGYSTGAERRRLPVTADGAMARCTDAPCDHLLFLHVDGWCLVCKAGCGTG